VIASRLERFGEAYALVRASEGRGSGGEAELLGLPYVSAGPLAKQWQVRARTFDEFLTRVVQPLERRSERSLRVLDLGAGNGWLSARLTRRGHLSVAVDLRTDAVDGLAAAGPFRRSLPRMFPRVAASFELLPFRTRPFDLVLFDASLHYAEALGPTLAEAARVTVPGGCVAILDSPFYRRAASGQAMAAEKRRAIRREHGDLADALLAVEAIEYLTRERLDAAASPLGLAFRRHRVRYPLWYEARPALAFFRRQRPPSRFDLWEAEVP
jgi:SAM-dependent methyltransferase